MCVFRKRHQEIQNISSKFHMKDYVDFHHRDDIYFGVISDIRLDANNEVIYDIDIAGQCPTTFTNIPEKIVIGIHKGK